MDGWTDGRTDGRTLPSTLSPSLAVDKNTRNVALYLSTDAQSQVTTTTLLTFFFQLDNSKTTIQLFAISLSLLFPSSCVWCLGLRVLVKLCF